VPQKLFVKKEGEKRFLVLRDSSEKRKKRSPSDLAQHHMKIPTLTGGGRMWEIRDRKESLKT